MSVIDKWLNIHRQSAGPATSATNPDMTCNSNELDVAGHLLRAATFPPDVATCSSPVATENTIEDQYFKAGVAAVADVATGEKRRAAGRTTVGYPICCECRLPIAEQSETWWGGERCHRACGEAAFDREKTRRGLGGVDQSNG